jgi:hypothetical protein
LHKPYTSTYYDKISIFSDFKYTSIASNGTQNRLRHIKRIRLCDSTTSLHRSISVAHHLLKFSFTHRYLYLWFHYEQTADRMLRISIVNESPVQLGRNFDVGPSLNVSKMTSAEIDLKNSCSDVRKTTITFSVH